MKGYALPPGGGGPGSTGGTGGAGGTGDTGEGRLAPWEALVGDAVGTAIEFWGFKRNQGRVWCLLYLRDEPMTAAGIQEALGLSKGAVSMVTRELEQWHVVRRVRAPGGRAWRFEAEHDFVHMIRRVVQERESVVLARIRAQLQEAERDAKDRPDTPPSVLDRLRRLRQLAQLMEKAVGVFLQTATLDVRSLGRALERGSAAARTSVRDTFADALEGAVDAIRRPGTRR